MSALEHAVSHADITRWEAVAAVALVEVLDLARLRDLPPLYWGISGVSGLQGHVPDSLGEGTDRTDWQRWVDALGLTVHRSTQTSAIEHVRAFRTYTTRTGFVTTVTVRAALHIDVPLSARAVTPYWQRHADDYMNEAV